MYSGNLDISPLAVDENDAHLAAAAGLAPAAVRSRSEQPRPPQYPVVEVAEVDCHSLQLKSHWDYHELIQPSET